MTKLYLEEGDAMLIVRKDGNVYVALDSHDMESKEPSEAGLMVLGLINCLDNDSWKQNLIARMKEKIAASE